MEQRYWVSSIPGTIESFTKNNKPELPQYDLNEQVELLV